MSARATGISITPRRGLARAACPQAIFISLCTNLRGRREGEASDRTELGRVTTRPGSRLDRRGNLLFSVSLRGHPPAHCRRHPAHRPWRAGDEGHAPDVSRLSAGLCVSVVYSAASGPTRPTGRRPSRSGSRGRDGSFLHELRFADRDRDLVLPELRRPPCTLTVARCLYGGTVFSDARCRREEFRGIGLLQEED